MRISNVSKTPAHIILQSLSIPEAIIKCFSTRDHRAGLGKRDTGREYFNWLAHSHPVVFLKLFRYIPEIGRWDDLLYMTNKQVIPFIDKFILNQINNDIFNMSIGLSVSMCAKWLPSEGKSFSRNYKKRFDLLLQNLEMTPKQYRHMTASLRKYAGISERDVCSRKNFKLDYEKLSTGARRRYKTLFPPSFIGDDKKKRKNGGVKDEPAEIYEHILKEIGLN
jgi:hypothetical protein